ncbi:MAG TPA: serine hydrolase domain-containing protein [Verrucomicrobiae bacterium]
MNRREFVGGVFGSALAMAWPQAANAADRNTSGAAAVDDLDVVLAPVLRESGLPALAAGAVKEGRICAAGAVGLRMAGAPARVTVEEKFHIGSCTKAMTATLAAMAVEEDKLKWESSLASIFPERRDKMDSAFREVTLEMLLTHRAGLPHDGSYYGKPRAPVTEQRLAYMDAVLAEPPPNKVDSFNYSNAGYLIAGAMLERVTAKSWEEAIRERLFKPLAMTTAGFGVAMTDRQTDQPWGHVLKDNNFVPRYGDNHRALGPAGTVHCSIKDYLKFAALHASLGSRPPGLLNKESCDKLHEPAKDGYAMGWGVVDRSWARGKALTHAGSNTMNYFVVWVAPKLDFALAVATNAAGDKAPAALDRVAGALVKKFCS